MNVAFMLRQHKGLGLTWHVPGNAMPSRFTVVSCDVE
jgi:hypothetical protein